ncbi:hypothetical protein BW1_029_00370 [Bacillus mycoides NBRC 101238 = DSM 11821]|nr:hypothetical protein BW1_029_00370 [Bacillus mycoides NBRC 101238 = DSM 11821]
MVIKLITPPLFLKSIYTIRSTTQKYRIYNIYKVVLLLILDFQKYRKEIIYVPTQLL